jgi:hypothetical protein
MFQLNEQLINTFSLRKTIYVLSRRLRQTCEGLFSNLLYKCPEEHRFQAAGNERKKERILIERMKERKQEKEKERKKERKKEERKKEKSRQTAG